MIAERAILIMATGLIMATEQNDGVAGPWRLAIADRCVGRKQRLILKPLIFFDHRKFKASDRHRR